MRDWGISERAAAVHREAMVWDMVFPLMDPGPPEQRYAPLTRMAASGYDFVSLTVALDWDGVAETLAAIGRERAYLLANADRYVLVETVDDIAAARQQGKLAVSLHFQGTNPVDYDVDMVEVYYKLGVRHMLLAYNARNAAGDGWIEKDDGGLSRFGISLIETMNRVGMMVDASHTGYRTTMEMFEVSRAPVVFSHANPRAMHDHGRNIRDDQITACARSGGVIGLTGVSLFLGSAQASPEALADHVHYVAELVGVRHVGLGLDYVFDQQALAATINARRAWTPPDESFAGQPQENVTYLQPEQLPKFTEVLLARGYCEADVRGILGGNWLRVARQVWK